MATPRPRDLNHLTLPEQLWLWRRRQPTATPRARAGRDSTWMSQAEAAAAIGVSVNSYVRFEAGQAWEREVDRVTRCLSVKWDAGVPSPTLPELCALARRRSGLPLDIVEQLLGVSRPTYLLMERQGDPRVASFWAGRGYRFPTEYAAYCSVPEPIEVEA